MKYFKSNNRFVIRLDKNDKIIASIEKVCHKEEIKTGFISGIGALKNVEIGRYILTEKKFIKKRFEGEFEIVSLLGNITPFENNDINIHLHISLANEKFELFGGHLVEGEISATAEIFIYPENFDLKRVFDKDSGLNLID